MAKSLPPLAELREWLRYDAETGEFYWLQCSGKKMRPGKKAGWITSFGYVNITLNDHRMPGHRLAWLFVHGEDPGDKMIDHINGVPSDNRICNLRLATARQNACNQRKQDGTTSAYKGVTWYKRKGKWMAQIRINGKAKHLGYFHDEMAAHMAYCQAAHDTFGEFARFD
jgi:hypothetical protein